jgi:signal transduction histidine kinase
VLQDGYVRGHETVCRDRDGRSIIVDLTATSLSDEANTPGEMSLILRDVTQRKRREDEIRRLNTNLNQEVAERTRELAEKVNELALANSELKKVDQMRSEFVSLVSHQIRAPLTNMRGAVERMQCDCQLITSTCSRMFVILNQQVERLDSLVRDVLNTARIEAGENVIHPEPISLLPVVEQVIDQTGSRIAERNFVLLPKPGLPLVYADRDRVAEVIANLLDNADKFSPPGEKVTVEVQADSNQVTVSVRDHGPGAR